MDLIAKAILLTIAICVGVIMAFVAIAGFVLKFGQSISRKALKDSNVASVTVGPKDSPYTVTMNLQRDQVAS